jgi:DNA-binding XRE family transcriptional regulator
MAKARMLHGKISRSLKVHSLPTKAQLLFSWMITHADDDGRLRGEPNYIKATVVPLENWSLKKINMYLELIKDAQLIYYWELNSAWYVEFVHWKEYQQIRSDRYKPSNLPSYLGKSNNESDTKGQPTDTQRDMQSNIVQSNPEEFNKSESKETEHYADKDFTKIGQSFNPKTFVPKNEDNKLNSKGNFTEKLARNIKRAREMKKLSQEELSDRAGVYRTYIGHIENGRYTPSTYVLYKIVIALEVPVSTIFPAD